MKDYDVYIFDFDGTLFDTEKSLYKVFRDAFAAANIYDITDEECLIFMRHNLYQVAEMRNVPKECYPAFGAACLKSLDEPETIAKSIPFPETLSVLLELQKRGKRIAVCSGNTTKHIKLILEYCKWPDLFESFMGSDIYKHGKPSPEPLEFSLREMNLEPSDRIVYIGDSLQDDVAGKAAGLETILLDRYHEYSDFKGNKIYTLEELL